MDIDVRSIDLREAFNMLKTVDDNSNEYKETENKVIKGINIKFNINDLLNLRGNIVEKGKLQKVIINGKVYKMEDYDEELMAREKLAKAFLINKLEGRQIAKPRGIQ